MAASVNANLTLRDGTVKSFTKPIGSGDQPVDLKNLQNSLVSLQQETNKYLTTLVEQEKQIASSVKGSENSTKSQECSDDDDDDESEDEEDKNKEPVMKKQKR